MNQKHLLHDYTPVAIPLTLATGKTAYAEGLGRLYISPTTSIEAVFIPDVQSILSVSQMTALGYICLFSKNFTAIFAPNELIQQHIHSLMQHYQVNAAMKVHIPAGLQESIMLTTPGGRIHSEFGHINLKKLQFMGFQFTAADKEEIASCAICKSVKFKRIIPKSITPTTTKPGEAYSVDLSGPYYQNGQKMWLIVLLDDHSRFLTLIPTFSKKSVPGLIEEFIQSEAHRFGYFPSKISLDMGTEFLKLSLPHIVKVISPVGNKEKNGRIERVIQTIHRLHGCLTAHLTPEIIDRYLQISFLHVENIYNIIPHTFTGVSPISIYHNNSYTYKSLPLLFEDVTVYNNKFHTVNFGVFVRFDLVTHLFYIMVNGKEVSTTEGDFKRLGTFKLLPHSFQDIPSTTHLLPARPSTNFHVKLPTSNHPLSFLLNMVRTAPRSYNAAVKDLVTWEQPIGKERNNFLSNQAFVGVADISTLSNKVYLSSFWHFIFKSSSGQPKSRLIIINPATIHHRQAQFSSPVLKPTTFFSFILLFGTDSTFTLGSCDISGAFLSAPIPDDGNNYVLKTPQGFTDIIKEPYVLLKKSVYGLNFSPMAFFQHLVTILHKSGYSQAPSDQCLHLSTSSLSSSTSSPFKEVIINHVDDFLLLLRSPTDFLESFTKEFTITQPDSIDYFIGYELRQSSTVLRITLCEYITSFVESLDSDDQAFVKRTGVVTPSHEQFKVLIYPPEGKVSLLSTELLDSYLLDYIPIKTLDQVKYQHYTGVLNYITTKFRFDISFYSHVVSRYNHYPHPLAYQQILKIFQYLYQTREASLFIHRPLQSTSPANSSLKLQVYTDASFHSSTNSYGGFVIFGNNFYLNSCSWRITDTMQHSYGAELFALHAGVQDARSILVTLLEMGFECSTIDVYCDNLSLVHTITTLTQLHMPSTYIYKAVELRDLQFSKAINLQHIAGATNPADIFTKKMYGKHLLELLRAPVYAHSFAI